MLPLTFVAQRWVFLYSGVFGYTVSAFYEVYKHCGRPVVILVDHHVKLILDNIESSIVVLDKCVCCYMGTV